VRLSDLLGQDTARTALVRALAGGHVGHAYLFEGPAGVGKRGAAYGLAMALDCTVAPGAGCGACEVCRRIEAGTHPDVPAFAPSGPGGQLVIEDVRTVVALARTRPHEAAARVIVIDDADAMNPSAANSLLKTLEEPVPRNHLVLCTSAADRLLPTIRSRTQRIRFRRLTDRALADLAKARGVPPDRAAIAIAMADGSARHMLDVAGADEQAGVSEVLAALRAAVAAPSAAAVFDFAAETAGRDRSDPDQKNGKRELADLLTLVGRMYRDALAVAVGAPELAPFAADASAGSAHAALVRLGAARLGRALAAVFDAQQALVANVNPVLSLERLLFALKRQEGATT
jgi:DNA polymerase-3 subunit delta'